MRRPLEEVVTLHDQIRAFEGAVPVPEIERDLFGDVPGPLQVVQREIGARRRLGRVEERLEDLVGHLYGLARGARRAFVARCHRRDGVSDVADLVQRQGVLVAGPGDDAVLQRHVLARDDGVDAVERLGSAGVDRQDLRVRVGRAQQPGVEHLRQGDVVGVLSEPGHLCVSVYAPVATSDDRRGSQVELRHGLHLGDAHGPAASCSVSRTSAAWITASRIFT